MIIDNTLNDYFFKLYKKNLLFLQKKAIEKDIALGQILCLNEIYNNEGLSQESLAKILSVDKATVTRAMKVMIEKDFVYREKSEIDKRAYGIFLTNKGKVEYENISRYFFELEKSMCENLTEEERKQLLNLLEKVCSSKKLD